MNECHTCGPVCYCDPEPRGSSYMGDPYLPPGCSDNDDYFDMPSAHEAESERDRARTYYAEQAAKVPTRIAVPEHCEVCNGSPVYIQYMVTGQWLCLMCAHKAGEPSAAMFMAYKSVEELLLKPTIDADEKEAA